GRPADARIPTARTAHDLQAAGALVHGGAHRDEPSSRPVTPTSDRGALHMDHLDNEVYLHYGRASETVNLHGSAWLSVSRDTEGKAHDEDLPVKPPRPSCHSLLERLLEHASPRTTR